MWLCVWHIVIWTLLRQAQAQRLRGKASLCTHSVNKEQALCRTKSGHDGNDAKPKTTAVALATGGSVQAPQQALIFWTLVFDDAIYSYNDAID
jgi:hypothetical protein